MPIDPWLPRAAALRPDRIALEAPEGALTYAELLDAARIDAAPGSRVALALPPGLDFAVALHACLLARAAAMPVDPRLGEAEQAALLASASLVVDGALPRCGAAAPWRRPTTTRRCRAHERDDGGAAAGRAELREHPGQRARLGRRARPRPRRALAVPAAALARRRADGAAALGDLRHPRRARRRRSGPRDDDITVVSLVPTQLRRLLDAGARPGARLRVVLLGGAAATPDLLDRARAAGWPVAATYGLTQACSQVAVDGRALPGLAISLAPDGEILVEGPTVAGGGVLRTGDLGRFDETGRLHVIGRKSDTIVTGGENVAPAEVEAALLAHPAVADAGVFGRPDPEWGEAVTASVVLRSPAEPQELREWVAGRLARFKVPKAVEPVGELPRNPSGKLLRRELS